MENVRVSFEGVEGSLSIRRFEVREQFNQLFHVSLVAMSADDSLDLSQFVGARTEFVLSGPTERRLRGLCERMSLVRTPATLDGLATYEIEIVPTMWRLSQRRNNRLFQHVTLPEIVGQILDEHGVRHEFRLDRGQYPDLELRTQYDETDFAFVSRLLEEAGITFYFSDEGANDSTLVLTDAPHLAQPRMNALPFVEETVQAQAARIEFVTRVVLMEQSRPGKVTLRDYDLRRPRLPLFESVSSDRQQEAGHEQYHHLPGSFLRERVPSGTRGSTYGKEIQEGRERIESNRVQSMKAPAASSSPIASQRTKVADDRGVARVEEGFGQGLAKRMVESLHADRRTIRFGTSAPDLRPGVVFRIEGHPRKDISSADTKLLMIQFRMQGTIPSGDDWVFEGTCVFADRQYRPPMVTSKPRIHGMQSAVVVGPDGPSAGSNPNVAPGVIGDQEIYVDEFGRVRVQFNWDREGQYDGGSSMWMRVSQGWAGAGYGLFTIPRVGHEVLVAYLDGDPDSPIIVGRVHNVVEPVPHDLPANATVSTWKTSSSPGGKGFNELRFDDAAGREHVFIQAQKDMDHLVKNDLKQAVGHNTSRSVQNNDAIAVGHDRVKVVNHNEVETTGLNRATVVGVSRATTVGIEDSTMVGTRWSVTIARGMTSRLVKELEDISKGPLGSVLRSAAGRMLGGIPGSPLSSAASAALAGFGEAAIGSLKNVLSVIDGFQSSRGPSPTAIEMVDRQIKLSTGEASIILDGPNVTITAQGAIALHALKSITVLGEQEVAVAARERAAVISGTDEVLIQAGTNVQLNQYEPGADAPVAERIGTSRTVPPKGSATGNQSSGNSKN